MIELSEHEITRFRARESTGFSVGLVVQNGAFLFAVLMVDRQRFHGGVEEFVSGMFHVAGFEQVTLQSNRRSKFETHKVVLFGSQAPEKRLAFVGSF